MHRFPTVNSIIDNILETWSRKDLAYVHADLDMFGSVGRAIRNEYGLWHDNPLTEKWRTDPSSHVLIDGVDHSEDHPDNMSGTILKALRERLNHETFDEETLAWVEGQRVAWQEILHPSIRIKTPAPC